MRSKASLDASGSVLASTAFEGGERVPTREAVDFWRLLDELADRAAAELAACARACCTSSGSGIIARDSRPPRSSCRGGRTTES